MFVWSGHWRCSWSRFLEFMDKNEVIKHYPDGLRYYSQIIKDVHRSRWAKGSWTDDTDMMLCILDGFENGKFNVRRVASNFKDHLMETLGIEKHTNNVLHGEQC